MFKTKCCWLLKSFDHRNILNVEKRYTISKTSTIFPPPQNCLGTRRDKHTKKLESNNYAGTLPWKLLIASQGYWKWSDNIFHVTAGNVKFVVSQWPNSHPFKFFCTKRDYIAVTQFWKYCTVGWKKSLETAECWSIKSIWFRAELNFCPKIVAGRQECIAKKEVWERRSYTKHKGRLIRLQEFPHWIFLFHFSATVLYTRKNCHLLICAAPGATRRNWNLQVTLQVQKVLGMSFPPHYTPAGRSDANQ